MDEGFVDLAKTPEENREAEKPEEPIYPFNLCITLEDEQIDKLGLEDGEIGDFLHAAVLMKLVGLHKNAMQDGDKKYMNLQICFMKILGDEDEESEEAFKRPTASDLYDDGR